MTGSQTPFPLGFLRDPRNNAFVRLGDIAYIEDASSWSRSQGAKCLLVLRSGLEVLFGLTIEEVTEAIYGAQLMGYYYASS